VSHNSEPDPRIYFAAERTFLAWVRTGLALMGFGFVVARFGLFLRLASPEVGAVATGVFSRWFGIGLVLLGVVLMASATAGHIATVRRLNRGEQFVGRPTRLGIAVASVLAIAGAVMSVYLFLSP
jgi:putative membrane protein